MSDLDRALHTVVHRCLAVAPGEDVLVIADHPLADLGRALRDAAAAAGADAVLALMDPREADGTEPPPTIAAALGACEVFIAPTTRSLSHTRARRQACDSNGARGATMPGVTDDMLARLLSGDFATMQRRSQAVAQLLTRAAEARVTCPRGTDLRLDLRTRAALADDGDLRAPGTFGNLPCGEGFVAPLSGEGRLFPTSLASIGAAAEPPELEVRDGQLVGARGREGEELLRKLEAHGRGGTNLAELGVGTNPDAVLGGNVLEDEKILGSVHIAFGADAAFGGEVSVPIHLDTVVLDATLEVDGIPVLESGRFVLDA